ncbi:MAG: hypothetical protein QOE38_1939, partial [Thermoleophilaceae bacterium]|nr:hypothetical protein [Thermoleophilaceae bacterium]
MGSPLPSPVPPVAREGYGCAVTPVVLSGDVTADEVAAIGHGATVELDPNAL